MRLFSTSMFSLLAMSAIAQAAPPDFICLSDVSSYEGSFEGLTDIPYGQVTPNWIAVNTQTQTLDGYFMGKVVASKPAQAMTVSTSDDSVTVEAQLKTAAGGTLLVHLEGQGNNDLNSEILGTVQFTKISSDQSRSVVTIPTQCEIITADNQ